MTVTKGKRENGIVHSNGTNKSDEINSFQSVNEKKMKSRFWAYFWWFFGGLFGAHHLYLGRDAHAFIWFSTLGGYFGIGWLRDFFKIPTYVDDANDHPKYVEWFKFNVRHNKKPPFSTVRFVGAIIISYIWGQLTWMAIPQEEIYGMNLRPLMILVPFSVALGVWVVGNIGREEGSLWVSLVTAYMIYPTLYYIGDDSTWLSLMVVLTTLAFDTFSKKWRLKPREKRSPMKRCLALSCAICLYLSLWTSYFYFNAVVTDSDGEEIRLSEAVKHFFTSPIWLDLKTTLWSTWEQMKNQGFWATWHQLIDMSDLRGEINAYRVLGLSQTASESEITAKWRSLSKEYHPDKVKGSDEERRAAQERFMEIQQAYEILSSTKNRRQRRNRRAG
ncbi:dnaJ homolog subfamily C member 22 [Chelonus insularis]|uniref:dnaJ homolog subfamily C member 22 n=1 Tax=Chelonus insularis TaxID=460826 RepID=UPI00158EF865|nr:dnaJ homolog subfamily C member 22 [Chelonus insularis]XP_034947610.1 dnaJ homolog subfamily C member 22 [Chelonus insularis]